MDAINHARSDHRRTVVLITMACLLGIAIAVSEEARTAPSTLSEQEIYGVDSVAALRSRPFRNWDSIEAAGRFYVPEKYGAIAPRVQTEVELPEVTARQRGSKEFQEYWKQVEKDGGIDQLRGRLGAWDLDKTWLPHFYLFDSSLVVFPFPLFFVLREKRRK